MGRGRGWRVAVGLFSALLVFAGCGGGQTFSSARTGTASRAVPLSASEVVYVCASAASLCVVPGAGGGVPRAGFTSFAGLAGGAAAADGTKVAYSSSYNDGRGNFRNLGLWVTASGAAGNHRIVDGSSFGCGSVCFGRDGYPDPGVPAWSPDGTELAVTEPTANGADPACRIWVVAATGSHPRTVRDGSGKPVVCGSGALAWSPDGRTLAYGSDNGVDEVPVSGGNPKLVLRLPTTTAEGPVVADKLDWSPDGSTLLVTLNGHSVAALPAKGGQPKLLLGGPVAGVPGLQACATSSGCGGDARFDDASYSPDGTRIVAADATSQIDCSVDTAPADGGAPTALVDVHGACQLAGWVAEPANGLPSQSAAPGYAEVHANGQVTDFGTGLPTTEPIAGLRAPIVAAVIFHAPLARGSCGPLIDELVGADGTVYGSAGQIVGHAGQTPRAPIVAAVATEVIACLPNLVMVASDGSTYQLNRGYLPLQRNPAVAASADGKGNTGYWVVNAQGNNVINASNRQTLPLTSGNASPSEPVTAIADDPLTGGYWLVTSAGTVTGHGAPVQGTPTGGPIKAPIVAMVADATTGGYWLLGHDCSVYSANTPAAPNSTAGTSPCVAILAKPPATISNQPFP